MIDVLTWVGVLQVLKALAAAICLLRVHFNIQASNNPEHERGRRLLKAVAALCLSGVLTALFWEFFFFGENVIPFRSYPHYQWGLLALVAIAEAPFFLALAVLWDLMDGVNTDVGER